MAQLLKDVFILFSMVLVATVSAQYHPKFPAILIMGDSLVDGGNNNNLPDLFSIARANHLPYGRLINYPTGRFLDGYTLPDLLARKLNISLAHAFLDPNAQGVVLKDGINLASGGCAILDSNSAILTPYNMTEQLRWFGIYKHELEAYEGAANAASRINGLLIVISIGSNDFSYKSLNSAVSGLSDSQYRTLLLNTFKTQIQTIYNYGGRNFYILALGPLGCTPVALTTKCLGSNDTSCRQHCNETTNGLVIEYNHYLGNMLSGLQSNLTGSKFYFNNDSYTVTYDAIKHPAKYGFQVPDLGCCGSGYVEIGDFCNLYEFGTCANASGYIFFDAIHPTSSFTSVLAHRAYTFLGI